MTNVIVFIGTGAICQAVAARRVGSAMHALPADLRQENTNVAARALSDAGWRKFLFH
jgi:hypothetical protein